MGKGLQDELSKTLCLVVSNAKGLGTRVAVDGRQVLTLTQSRYQSCYSDQSSKCWRQSLSYCGLQDFGGDLDVRLLFISTSPIISNWAHDNLVSGSVWLSFIGRVEVSLTIYGW